MIKNTTIQLFAIELKISVDQLIQWFSCLGIFKTESSVITKVERDVLFKYMNTNKIDVVNKLILQRKTRSTLNVSSIGGKNKQVHIEIRKKRTYVQCSFQDTEVVDRKNKTVISRVNNKLISLAVTNNLMNKKVDSTVIHSSISEEISKKNDTCTKSIEYLEKETEQVCRKVVKNSSQMAEETQVMSKYPEYREDIELNSTMNNTITKDSFDSIKLYSIPVLSRENNKNISNNKKLENERLHRSRARTRCRSSVKFTKQRDKRGNSYSLNEFVLDDFGKEEFYAPNRIGKNKRKQSVLLQSFKKPIKTITRDIIIGETISVAALANKMSIKGSSIIKVMMNLGIVATINQIIDQETAQLIAEEMGHNVLLRCENELEELIIHDRDIDTNSIIVESRAPIVTIMGHVDHGKTSLLDRIRSTKVADSETGGITQSIGAYHVRTNNGVITFLDTPGHAAFTAMRARGIQLTDIVVLVVAADDGVMPQTIEAIQHIKSANIPVIVAINKIDKLDVNLQHIKNDLNNHGLVPEEWGGDTQFVNVSALSGVGVDDLLDAILLQSEILELKVTCHGMARAIVIESFLDKRRGPVVSVLVREGTLKCGDIILCGTAYGRVRAMRDEYGRDIALAGPSIPAEVLGLSGVPNSGEMVIVVRDERKAREVALYRQGKFREVKLSRKKELNNVANVFDSIKNNNVIQELHVIIKSDTQGSAEAIRDALEHLSTNDIKIKILYSSIGGITETDAALAAASSAIILGFNVRANTSAKRLIEIDRLDVRYYSVIYDLLNEVKQEICGMLKPQYKHEIVGIAEVRNVFHSPKYGSVAGCIVIEGMVKRYKKVRIIRDNIVIYEGELESLRRFKHDVNEVSSGIECGIGIKNYNDIRSGDVIEVFDTTKKTCI